MIEIKTVNLKRAKVNTLVVPVCEDQDIHTDSSVASLIDMAKAYDEFNGKKGETFDPVSAGRHPDCSSAFFRAWKR